ncbi:Bcr/CflA family multidrug efflux MFS transporter [Arhodomonas sp. SL1]|uniref:Bcr/CflA family multidrug efflux MFS transporter n=1 Tax=Arhodomonas sp. SL1 TaxID=3425691 RepID=UPI003F8817B1
MLRTRVSRGIGLIAILGLLTAFGPMSIDLYLPGLPGLARELDASAAAAQQSLSLFFIGLAIGQLIYGPFSDRYGRRPVLAFSILVYLVASVLCAVATSLPEMLAGRLLQGLGAAAGPVVSRAIIRDVHHGAEAARAMSFVILVMAVAPLIAPLLGGQIVDTVGWRGIFWVLTGFGLVCLAMVTGALPETNGRARRGRDGLGRRFVAYTHLLRDRASVAYLLCGGMAFGALFAYVASSSFLYIEVHGVSPRAFGYYFALNVLGLVAANLANGVLVRRFGYRRLLAFGAAVTFTGSLALLATTLSGFGGLAGVAVPLFFAVGMVGLVGANTVTGLLDSYPDHAGAASALFGFFQFGLGAAAGGMTALVGIGAAADMAVVMSFCAGISVLAAAYLLLSDRPAPAPQCPSSAG